MTPCLKTSTTPGYNGEQSSTIVDLIPPDKWRHVRNPADCASRGVYPSELLNHSLWWNGPHWLKQPPSNWPEKLPLPQKIDEKEVSLHVFTQPLIPIIAIDHFSSFGRLRRITSWMICFIQNCQSKERNGAHLTTFELQNYWIKIIQAAHFELDLMSLQRKETLPRSSSLLPLQPFLDDSSILHVGGRRKLSQTSNYRSRHPAILHGKHPLTRFIVHEEHLRLLHAGPTLLTASLSRCFHIACARKMIRSVARKCITCRRSSASNYASLS